MLICSMELSVEHSWHIKKEKMMEKETNKPNFGHLFFAILLGAAMMYPVVMMEVCALLYLQRYFPEFHPSWFVWIVGNADVIIVSSAIITCIGSAFFIYRHMSKSRE